VKDPDERLTITKPYSGQTAAHYQRLSDVGLAPALVMVTQNEIMALLRGTLEDWLAAGPSQDDKDSMAVRIRDLLRAVHEKAGICHRDVHVGNIVLDEQDRPLLIGPKWAVPVVNEHCYDLEGPGASGIEVPELHVRQGHDGVWWGSSVAHRALSEAFGPPPG
jgi:hypothetical protein